ncbi:MAG: hypothetical protein JOY77_07580 [Alphaproteobacteria bacterium]|uniref:hypothetical protein n=1 Tax=Bradyrhizobium sp. TaxID=376 RepID=UPI001D9A339D|nr:hypothetical protein [Bradyrhizobium sp.]MBV9062776.1 hypothetical protein [Alphaproteobacteria bacterium]MBV9560027.1 hypothetical protein [Bradyrhizobium sp.]
MIDPLFARAQLAIEESRQLQLGKRALRAERECKREQLRSAIFESAMARSKSKAHRDGRRRDALSLHSRNLLY